MANPINLGRPRIEVVITGKLSKSRKEIIEEFAVYNIMVENSVKRSTDYLITDNPNSGSSKNAAASAYGVPKISENEFREFRKIVIQPWTINNKPITNNTIAKTLKTSAAKQKMIKKQEQIKPEKLKRCLVF